VKTLAREKDIISDSIQVAKEKQPFHKFEAEIDLQELNGIDMWRILHSANTSINIVSHVRTEMRKTFANEII
jgi:hypothetical protein